MTQENKRTTSVRFDVDILDRISAVKGRHSRSSYVNNALDIQLSEDEKRLEIV